MKKNQETDCPVSAMDVYNEWNDKICLSYRINKFKSLVVTKNYAFNLADVPDTSEYIEVQYPVSFFQNYFFYQSNHR